MNTCKKQVIRGVYLLVLLGVSVFVINTDAHAYSETTASAEVEFIWTELAGQSVASQGSSHLGTIELTGDGVETGTAGANSVFSPWTISVIQDVTAGTTLDGYARRGFEYRSIWEFTNGTEEDQMLEFTMVTGPLSLSAEASDRYSKAIASWDNYIGILDSQDEVSIMLIQNKYEIEADPPTTTFIDWDPPGVNTQKVGIELHASQMLRVEMFASTWAESATTTIPEPATVALLGIGIVGLAGAEVRRRRKKREINS